MYSLHIAIQDFIHHCTFEKNLSIKTLKSYNTDLKQFLKFLTLKKFSVDVKNISKFELQHYVEFISFFKPKTRKRKIATIKALLNYLEFEDKIIINPIRKMRIKIKEPFKLPNCLNFDEISAIFKTAYKELTICGKNTYFYQTSLRNLAVIELLFATGARVSEIANLKAQDIDLTSGKVTIKGKGNKERIAQISNNDSLSNLIKYKELFQDKIYSKSNFFLINRLTRKLSEQSIRKIVKNLSKKALINKNVTPHIFRHSFATLLLENEVDIKYIQVLLGHSSITTTQIYTHVNNPKIYQILKFKHPRKDISLTLNE